MESLAAGGRGVARRTGQVWFVRGALPGDRVEAEVRRIRRRFVEARVARLLQPAADRREPPCAVQDRCGGCPWMALERAAQLDWKGRLLRDALERIGGIERPPIEPVRAPSEELGYRNRVEFTLGLDSAGEPVLGLHAAEPDAGLVDVQRCWLQHEWANAVLDTARSFLLGGERALHDRLARAGPYRVLIRRSASSGELLVGLHETRVGFPYASALAPSLVRAHPGVVGVVRLRVRPGRRGGTRAVPLIGRAWIEERIGGIDFRLPAATFTQVSGEGGAELLRLVSELAGETADRRVLDLYGGVGVHAFAMVRAGAREASVCDADGAAIACGREAARRHGERRLRFVHADARAFLEAGGRKRNSAELIVANPPRRGFGPGVTQALAGRSPSRIVIVSCDPATLARDLRALLRAGYALGRLVPVDLFPQTPHVEAVAQLDRG